MLKRLRKRRTITLDPREKEAILSYIENNKDMANRSEQPSTNVILKWQDLASTLNSIAGAQIQGPDLKTIWTNIEDDVRIKYLQLKETPESPVLTEFENRVKLLIDRVDEDASLNNITISTPYTLKKEEDDIEFVEIIEYVPFAEEDQESTLTDSAVTTESPLLSRTEEQIKPSKIIEPELPSSAIRVRDFAIEKSKKGGNLVADSTSPSKIRIKKYYKDSVEKDSGKKKLRLITPETKQRTIVELIEKQTEIIKKKSEAKQDYYAKKIAFLEKQLEFSERRTAVREQLYAKKITYVQKSIKMLDRKMATGNCSFTIVEPMTDDGSLYFK